VVHHRKFEQGYNSRTNVDKACGNVKDHVNYSLLDLQAKKLRIGEPEDDIDDDFSDDDISEEEFNSFANRHKNSDDLADTISMRSDDIEEDEAASGDQVTEKRKSSTLKGLMQTMHTVDIFRKQKKEEIKVRTTIAFASFLLIQ
jgi:hypothetical protein